METKHEIMLRMSKEGHSFPHWDTCGTCEDDFDEVCKWERLRLCSDFRELVRYIFRNYPKESLDSIKSNLLERINKMEEIAETTGSKEEGGKGK